MAIVNTSLMKSPFNWLIVWMMLLIAAFAGHFLLKAGGFSPAKRASA
jgi:hypothetical protein